MANTIKLKTGSGSDPSASDLIVGEIAIRTDSGKLFTKKDNGSVAEISGSGGGIDDGDKGDITVSNGGDTFTIDNGVVTSAKIADGTIVNADISGSAAIEGSKLQAAGLVNAGSMSAANFNKLAGIEANATADMTGSEILSTISGENIILGEISSTGNSSFAGNLTVSSSDGGSSAAPELDLYRISASPADADYLGQIKFSGESDDGSKEVYAKITGKIGDASSGTEDGIIEIAHTKAGSNNISARFTSTDLKLINGTGLEVAGETDLSELTTITKTTSSQTESILKVLHSNLTQGIGLGYNTISAIGSNSAVNLRFESKGAGEIYMIDKLNALAALDVTGSIVVSGTVDGVDIATRDTLFGGLTSSSGVLTNGVTATTQSAGDNSTKVATTAYTDTAVSNLVDSAPSALNTLNELAAALGDDANFSTTVTNSIATKLPLTGGTMTGDLTITRPVNTNNTLTLGGSGAYTSFLKLLCGGAGSGLIEVSGRSDGNNKLNFRVGSSTIASLNESGDLTVSGTVDGRDVATDGTKLDGIESNATADQTASEILSLLSNQNISTTGTLSSGAITTSGNLNVSNSDPTIVFSDSDNNPDFDIKAGGGRFSIRDATNNVERLKVNSDGHIDIAGNLDIGAGCDVTGNITVSGTVDGRDVATDGTKLDGIESNATADQTASEILTLIKTVDGSGSGLDADTVDGIQGANFVRSDVDDSISGFLTITNDSGLRVRSSTNNVGAKINFSDNAATSYSQNGTLSYKHGDGQVTTTGGNSNDGWVFEGTETRTVVKVVGDIEATSNIYGAGANITALNASNISSGTISAARVPTLNQNTTGSAATLTTARTIAGTSFDGSANIDISYANLTNKLSVGDGGLTQNNFTNALKSKLDGIAAGATNVTNTNQLTNGAGFITATLTNEQVQDIVGGMVSSNTESGITVTYQDGDGTLDFAVASQTDNNFTNADHSKLDGIEAGATADQSNSEIKTAYEANSNTNAFTDALLSKLNGIAASATNVTNTNQLTNGAGFITSADGGNAATLDSIDSSQFARSDANDTLSGIITLSNSSRDTLNFSANSTDDNRGLAFNGRIAISADYNDGYLRLNNASEFGNGIYTPLVIRADGGFQVGGTTVVNGSAQLIASRLTGSLPAIDGSALTGIAAGATGGGSDQIFYENGQTVTTSYTITNGKNAMAAGPITINSGVTVTVGSGENLTIV